MKSRLVFFFIILPILFVSCSKSNNSTSNSTSVTFTSKGVLYSFPIAAFIKGPPGLYYLYASDSNTHFTQNLFLNITTDTLTKNYFTNQTANLSVDSVTYNGVGSWTVSITNVHNGVVDGTFSGFEDPASGSNVIPPIVINDGVFKNVIIRP
jgi:hypothetical protein